MFVRVCPIDPNPCPCPIGPISFCVVCVCQSVSYRYQSLSLSYRPNLFLEVHTRTDASFSDLQAIMVATKGRSDRTEYSFDGPTIVYCRTKAMTEGVNAILLSRLSRKTAAQWHRRFAIDHLRVSRV